MRFDLKALNERNEIVALRLDAATEALAREHAERQGYSVIAASGHVLALGALLGRSAGFPTTLFSIELLALLEAGLNLVEALRALSEKGRPAAEQQVISGIVRSLEEGITLSQAVARHPEHFSPLYVATIRSSERTGNVREALERYIAYQEELDRVRKKVVAASIYPAILVAVGTLVLAFLVLYVVPRFARVYEDVAIELPFFSSLLLALGGWVGQHGALVGLAALGTLALAAFALSRAPVRTAIALRLWRIPAVGERLKAYQLARLYRTLGMLLRAGVPIVRAIEMVAGLLAAHLQPSLERARVLIEEGKSVSAAFSAADLATPLGLRMMRVGEEGGRMGEMMERIARFLDDEIARFVEAFVRVFEPLLMAALGVAVGLVVVLMYMPIFELAGSLQ